MRGEEVKMKIGKERETEKKEERERMRVFRAVPEQNQD